MKIWLQIVVNHLRTNLKGSGGGGYVVKMIFPYNLQPWYHVEFLDKVEDENRRRRPVIHNPFSVTILIKVPSWLYPLHGDA